MEFDILVGFVPIAVEIVWHAFVSIVFVLIALIVFVASKTDSNRIARSLNLE